MLYSSVKLNSFDFVSKLKCVLVVSERERRFPGNGAQAEKSQLFSPCHEITPEGVQEAEGAVKGFCTLYVRCLKARRNEHIVNVRNNDTTRASEKAIKPGCFIFFLPR